MMRLSALALFALAACASATAPTAPAQSTNNMTTAADFTLNDTEGHAVALHDLLKQGPVILAFFPKAFTSG
jgi:hypothetical protein